MTTILTVDHAYDHGTKLELHFTERVIQADLLEIVAEIGETYGVDVIMVDSRGADFQLGEAVEDFITEADLGWVPKVLAVTDPAVWGDRYYEAKQAANG